MRPSPKSLLLGFGVVAVLANTLGSVQEIAEMGQLAEAGT
jgi:hypothetical protein